MYTYRIINLDKLIYFTQTYNILLYIYIYIYAYMKHTHTTHNWRHKCTVYTAPSLLMSCRVAIVRDGPDTRSNT